MNVTKAAARCAALCVLNAAVLPGDLRAAAGAPLINEVMSSNVAALADEDGEYPDWLELYNPADEAIDLDGYVLTDDPEDRIKWVFPSRTIAPGEFLVVFASDKDRAGDGELHANFRIKSDGESLLLIDPEGALCDSVFSGRTETDASAGRPPDGGPEWLVLATPTPGASNGGGFEGYAPTVAVSPAGGRYPSGVTVELSATSTDAQIRYTLDGSVPTKSSAAVEADLAIATTSVLRVRAFEDGLLPGPVTTATYLVDGRQQFPVVSLATDPGNLFDYDAGIYVFGPEADSTRVPYWGSNFWQDWERPVHVEWIEADGTPAFSLDAGIKIGGGWSRRYPRKSFNIIARNRYGKGDIDYALFAGLPYPSYDSFQLRNSGNDWGSTVFRDAFMTHLMQGMNLDTKAYRPVVVLVNGEYWGIYGVRERMNEEYMRRHYGVEADNLDIMEIEYRDRSNELVRSGDDVHYRALESFVASNPMSDPESYAHVRSQMDVDNFIDYLVGIIAVANYEWGGNNVKWWRPRTPEGRWRWLTYDSDRGFSLKNDDDYENDTLDKVLSVVVGRKILEPLLENAQFRRAFINRTADCLNTNFRTERLIAVIDSFQAVLDPEMRRHIERWDEPYLERGRAFYIADYDEWLANIEVMKTFARLRPEIVREHYRSRFGLSGMSDLTLDVSPAGAGKIMVNTVIPDRYPWAGVYFDGIPVEITAVPDRGQRFTGWSGIDGAGATVELVLAGATTLIAAFEGDPEVTLTVAINEINYHSAGDAEAGDWVEIINPTPHAVDVSGWRFGDAVDEHVFEIPPHTVIPASGYLVLASDIVSFHEIFPAVTAAIGNLGFDLSDAGERVQLSTAAGALVDSLTYDDTAPWPLEADGTGSTLALLDPGLDNGTARSWGHSTGNGTPGGANRVDTVVEAVEDGRPAAFALGQNYPNPFNAGTVIPFDVPERSPVILKVFSILGQEVAVLVEEVLDRGRYQVVFGGRGLASGVYFYTLQTGGLAETKAMVHLQ